MTAPTTQAEQEDAVREAWAYLTPHPYSDGPIILDPSKMRKAIATLRTERDQLAVDLRKAAVQISELAQAKGEAEGRLRASEMAGVVEGWREQNERLAADLRKAREEVDRLTNLADAAFHFFCCNDGIHRDDECGQLVSAMADIAKAIGFSNDPATDEEIAAVPVSSAAARAALTPDPNDAGGTAKGDEHGA